MFLVFPYRIERQFKMPWVTIGIMALCALMFVIQLLLGLERSYGLVGFKPNAYGALTWFTSMFAHGGLLHLLGNMYFLWVFGGVLEDAIGRGKYAMLYLAGGLVSTLAHSLMMLAFSPGEAYIPSLGASGAIAAIMGVAGVRFYKLNLRIWYFYMLFVVIRTGTFTVTAAAGLALYFARELMWGLIGLALPGGGVAYWAHIGGILFGVAVAFAFGFGRELDREEATKDAEGWAALGRHDMAEAALAEAGVKADEANVLLGRARQALYQVSPDFAAVSADAGRAVQLLLQQGRRVEAIQAFSEFGQVSTETAMFDAETLAAIGSACESTGQAETAACAYYDVLRLHPTAPETERALYRLAHVYLAQGKAPEAAQTWAAFVQHFPTSAWRSYADDRLSASA